MKFFLEKMNDNEQNKNIPYFAFNFMKYYTHDFLMVPPQLDFEFTEFLKYLDFKGYLENTLLILGSDHGNRIVSYTFITEFGKIERNLPFLALRLPKRLKSTRFELNALSNRNKLVSTFDLYKTLRHFFYMNKFNFDHNLDKCFKNLVQNKPHERSLRGISLFETIPTQRSCLDAIIPGILCSCSNKEKIEPEKFTEWTNSTFEKVSQFIAINVNQIAEKYREFCELFIFEKLFSVKSFIYSIDQLYQFQVFMQPGNALFEANIKITNFKNPKFEIVNKIIRLSQYGNQTNCLSEHAMLGFCFCKSL